MKTRIIYWLFFTFMIASVYAEVDCEEQSNTIHARNFYQIVIQFMQSLSFDSKKPIFLNFFYKGNVYRICVNNVIGSQINIFDEGEIPHNIVVVVTRNIVPIYNNDIEKIVTGLRSDDEAQWYHLTLKIIHGKNNIMSYKWDIKKISAYNENNIPRDALIIESGPKNISFLSDDEFCPDFPSARGESGTSHLLFLPLISYNENEKELNDSYGEDYKDYVEVSQCHIVCS